HVLVLINLLLVKEMEEEKKTELQGNRKEGFSRCQSRRQKKIALQQDVSALLHTLLIRLNLYRSICVDKLMKKLRQEENIHRALERAFTRPSGALPRLPPYLPSHTLELLAEVAVLEEEVARLEEQVVKFRQGLYQEAICISSSKQSKEGESNLCLDGRLFECSKTSKPSGMERFGLSFDHSANIKNTPEKQRFPLAFHEEKRGKENQWITNFSRNSKRSPVKHADAQTECAVTDRERDYASDEVIPNKLSEDIVKCLMNIFLRMSSKKIEDGMETSPSTSASCERSVKADFQDPYGICAEFGKRDIGPYKNFRSIEVSWNHQNLTASASLKRRLKVLLRKLESVDLSELTHQQKLAFWINIYNSCMMNAFLEQGIPTNPEMIAALMTKAVINVGGHFLSAITIEHIILRFPYYWKNVSPKEPKNGAMPIGGIFGLEWWEPLVTFALSCGSWSSPAVRVYTAAQVENELETAKRDYLQAAVGISTPNKLAIPKLLDWYLLDFAKDVWSLMDWICLQLPSELRSEAAKCLEMDRRIVPLAIQVLRYEFRFRYILAP
ncbi:unnamed protein product, partial [Musa banksii]